MALCSLGLQGPSLAATLSSWRWCTCNRFRRNNASEPERYYKALCPHRPRRIKNYLVIILPQNVTTSKPPSDVTELGRGYCTYRVRKPCQPSCGSEPVCTVTVPQTAKLSSCTSLPYHYCYTSGAPSTKIPSLQYCPSFHSKLFPTWRRAKPHRRPCATKPKTRHRRLDHDSERERECLVLYHDRSITDDGVEITKDDSCINRGDFDSQTVDFCDTCNPPSLWYLVAMMTEDPAQVALSPLYRWHEAFYQYDTDPDEQEDWCSLRSIYARPSRASVTPGLSSFARSNLRTKSA
jgi:hypothetical protein